jgi:phage tail tube protein FII
MAGLTGTVNEILSRYTLASCTKVTTSLFLSFSPSLEIISLLLVELTVTGNCKEFLVGDLTVSDKSTLTVTFECTSFCCAAVALTYSLL